VDVTFEVIDGDQRFPEGIGKRFRVADADQQRTRQTRADGDSDGVQVAEGDAGLRQRSADHGHDVAQMLAGSQLGDDSAIRGVDGNLRSDHIRKSLRTPPHNGGRGFITGAFDAQNQTTLVWSHTSIVVNED
jgi:hypothetical protein